MYRQIFQKLGIYKTSADKFSKKLNITKMYWQFYWNRKLWKKSEIFQKNWKFWKMYWQVDPKNKVFRKINRQIFRKLETLKNVLKNFQKNKNYRCPKSLSKHAKFVKCTVTYFKKKITKNVLTSLLKNSQFRKKYCQISEKLNNF